MAFFGLTMLGPQNSFQELLKKHSVLRIFEMSEFAAAFDSARSETVDQSQVLEILEVVYRGKLPAADAALCGEFFRGQEHFRKEEFLSIVERARAHEEAWIREENRRVSEGSEFASSASYRTFATRHARLDRDPIEKYQYPVTAAMENGWSKPQAYERPAFPKQSCDETVYQAELIKAGVYY